MAATTTAPMTVPEARRRLSNTSGMSADQVGDLRQVIDRFYETKPRKACAACRCMIWEEHTSADDGSCWACASCHRPASLTADEWWAQQQAAEAVRKVQDKTAAASAPKPRQTLTEALAKLTEVRKALAAIEAVLPAYRETLVAAQLKHDRAAEAAETAAEQAAQHLADSIQGRRMAGPAPSIAATRAALATAVDALVAAKNARTILDSRRTDARTAVNAAEAAARRAATRVLAAETLEDLIDTAINARAAYLESVSGLAWLTRSGAILNGDVRPAQLVRETDVPPSQWREALHADGGMTTRLNDLLVDVK